MPLTEDKINKLVVIVWLFATLLIVFFATSGGEQVLFGLPWIVVLSLICQVSLLGLFIFIAKRIWKCEEEPQ